MRRRHYLVTVAVFAYITATALWSALSTGLDHDEHQFMASAYLVAEHSLHPYQDFPYFHMPNLVYVYALFFLLTDYPFLLARVFSALCAMGISVMIFLVSRSLLSKDDERAALTVAASAAVLLTNSQLFASATGQAWNHTPSTLCALSAFVFHCQAIRRSVSWKYSLLSGFCLGLAIGIRLSLAPLIIPFLAVLFLAPARKRLLLGVSAFAMGGLMANIPAVYFLSTSTEQFLFGNLRYPRLNTLFRQEMNYGRAMTLGGKLNFFFYEIVLQTGNLLIVAVSVYSLLWVKLGRIRQAIASRLEFALLLLLLPFLYIGSFAPTPSWHQYFFTPLPFVVLVAPYGLAYLRQTGERGTGAHLLLLAAILSLLWSASSKTPASVFPVFHLDSWFPVRLHQVSAEIAGHLALRHGKEAKVLTLSPLYAVETKLPVYPEFATGQFAWRVSHLLSPDDRRLQSLVGPAEIERLIEKEPPIAILTTSEARTLIGPLTQTAQRLRYREAKLSDGSVLWIAPGRND